MADHPIIFSGLMVLTLLKDRKSQTRRIPGHLNTLFNGCSGGR